MNSAFVRATNGANRRSNRAARRFVLTALSLTPILLAACEKPNSRVGSLGFTLDAGASGTVPLTLAKPGQPLVRPLVNGKDVGWFILDTGAGAMAIAPKAAKAAGLREVGQVDAKGVAGSATKSTLEGDLFELGPLKLNHSIYVETAELEHPMIATALGPDIVGVAGYDIFERAIVEIDARGGYARVTASDNYPTPPGGWQELVFAERQPCVKTRFEGDRAGVFALDTGSNAALTFYTPAVKKHGLLEGRELSDGKSAGVGGAAVEKRGKLAWLDLGGRRFENINASFSTATDGVHSEDDADGVIGMELLKEFRLVIDYANRRIAFLPSTAKGANQK